MRGETDALGRLGWRSLERDYGRISHVAGPSLAPRLNHEQLQQDAGPAHNPPPVEERRARAQGWQMVARAGARNRRNKARYRYNSDNGVFLFLNVDIMGCGMQNCRLPIR